MASVSRLGIMGMAHSHLHSLMKFARDVDGVELVGIADPVRTDLAQGAAREFEIAKVYPDYDSLLSDARPDAVMSCAENSRHVDVVAACSAAGVPVMVEKPLAGTVAEARKIAALAEQGGIRVMCNWPILWSPIYHRLLALVREGALGRIFEFRYRAGHAGPTGGRLPDDPRGAWWFSRELGGGALLDFCCYGACLSRWLIGEPATSVVALADRLCYDFGDTEDNAVMLVRYPSAFALLEATWTQHGDPGPHGPIVWGTAATAFFGPDGNITILRDGREETVEPGALPVETTGPAHFVARLRDGMPFHQVVSLDHNLEVMAILDAGLQAAAAGQAVNL
jgi:predicted dehydrogenase